MNGHNARRTGVGVALTLVAGLGAGLVETPAHAATAVSWTDLVNQVNNATGALTVDLLTSIAQPAGTTDLAIRPGASITLDLHHNVLTAIAQGAGHAGIGLPQTARLIVEDNGNGAPGSLFATGAPGDTATGQGAGAGIGGNGTDDVGGAAGTLIVLAGNVTATGGATTTALGGAGAGVGGGGGRGAGTAPGAAGGAYGTVRVSGGTLTAQGGAGQTGGAGAGVGGGGGGAGGAFAGGSGGSLDGPSGLGALYVTAGGLARGIGGSVAGSGTGGGGAGIGGGGGGAGAPGGAGGDGLFVNLVPTATVNGTGGTSTNAGGGAGLGGGGGASGGTGGASGSILAPTGTQVVDSGPGAGGAGGADSVVSNSAREVGGWELSLTDTIGGRAPRGHSYTYLVSIQDNTRQTGIFRAVDTDALTVTLALPRGVTVTSVDGNRWTCSAGLRMATCAWVGPRGVPGTLLPISVRVTLAPDAPADAVLTATSTLTPGGAPAVSATDVVTVARHHHHRH